MGYGAFKGRGIWDMGDGAFKGREIWDMGYGRWEMGYGIWVRDVGCGIWDVGYGIWDMDDPRRESASMRPRIGARRNKYFCISARDILAVTPPLQLLGTELPLWAACAERGGVAFAWDLHDRQARPSSVRVGPCTAVSSAWRSCCLFVSKVVPD